MLDHACAQRIYDSLSFYGILYCHATTDVVDVRAPNSASLVRQCAL